MATPQILTVFDHIAWSYSNLARAHAALSAGRTHYVQTDHIIRSRLFNGLRPGRMAVRSIYYDEREKILDKRKCYYCSTLDNLTIDHIIPRIKGGADDGINLVIACRRCSSSKSHKDLLEWYESRSVFPPLMLLRRYIKILLAYCDHENLLEFHIESPELLDLPFRIERLPLHFPPLAELRL